jgi:16S rRNA C967 or C1407 C5-methylase (RsmB/RsmF family)/NOL1/NOP2/fmu family ribosome biogenesis protein
VKLPAQLLNSLQDVKGFDEEKFVGLHESGEKLTCIRINPFKRTELDLSAGEKIPWTGSGFYLNERPNFTFDPLFHAGCYYVQEAGSMFIEHVLKSTAELSEPLAVLDLCGAPGGKSTLINSLISEKSFLISNEAIKTRADVLAYNLSKWGTCNTAVTNCDPQIFSKLESAFDVIVADVPCSGSGLFRKQPEAVNEWSPDNVILCCTRQKRIIADCLPALKNEGVFIYSTCSYSKEENEDIVDWMITEFDLEFIPIPIEKNWGIVDTGKGYRFFPYLTKSEGFFCAALRKKGGNYSSFIRKKKSTFDEVNKKERSALGSWIPLNEDHVVFKFQNNFKLVNASLHDFLNSYAPSLYLKKTGTSLGELKREDFLPDHELALSIYLAASVDKTELNKEQAVSFLKKENLIMDAKKGITLMTYKNTGLGWAKVLDKRINNYLPKEFRILSREEF